MAMCGNLSLEAAVPQCKNLPLETIRREVDFAWLAGIIDGEGNLNIQVVEHCLNGKPYMRSKIRVANTDVRMVRKISEIYVREGLVFFTNIDRRKPKPGQNPVKTKINIEIASQGSSRKLLEMVIPYLANKRRQAETMLEVIKFVQTQPKGGNTLSIRYVDDPVFIRLMDEWRREFRWYIDPSETTRRARTVVSWPGA